MAAEACLIARLEESARQVLHARSSLWESLLEADLQCLTSCPDAVLASAVPILVDLLGVRPSDPLCVSALRAAVHATEGSLGARAFEQTLWGMRRVVKLAGSIELNDEARRLVDRLMEQTSGDPSSDRAASFGSRVAFEDAHREDMYPPTRLAFRRIGAADTVEPAQHSPSAWLEPGPTAGAAEEMVLALQNPSRRERFGSEIPSKIWPASVILSQLLWSRQHLVHGQTVLELGAGMGLVGLAAMRCGATSALLTDLDNKAVQHMRVNIANNLPTQRDRVEAAHLDWANPPDVASAEDVDGADASDAHTAAAGASLARAVLADGADVILAADIVNAPGLSELVYAMLVRYLRRAGRFLMVCPRPCHRHTVERLRSMLVASEHFETTIVDVPAWLSAAARQTAADARDMEPAEFEVIEYEFYHVRWR